MAKTADLTLAHSQALSPSLALALALSAHNGLKMNNNNKHMLSADQEFCASNLRLRLLSQI